MRLPFLKLKIPSFSLSSGYPKRWRNKQWEDVREEILSAIKEESGGLAVIKLFEVEDTRTGHKITLQTSPYYFRLVVNDKVYYFNKETGEFDGTSIPTGDKES